MKRIIITVLLGFGLCLTILAAPSSVYQNFGIITTPPTIDATVFYNAGTFDLDLFLTTSNFNQNVATVFNSLPFSPSDTEYYTNTTSGNMIGTPGFFFDTVTDGARHSASSFVNHGSITGLDFESFPDLYSAPGSMGVTPIVADSQPVPSQVNVVATNILNDGTISVGNYGLLQMIGSNVSLQNGALVAGALNTGDGFDADPIDTTSQSDTFYFYDENYYVNPPGVYDLFWGAANGLTLKLDEFADEAPETPPLGVEVAYRDSLEIGVPLTLPLNFNAEFASYVYYYDYDVSNTYINIVFVNTNFADANGQLNTNISATVEFTLDDFAFATGQSGDINQTLAAVQFAMAVPDVITGEIVTNAVYLLDDGGNFSPMVDYNNAGSADGYSRPNAFSVTTETPYLWDPLLFDSQANAIYTPDLIYTNSYYIDKDVTYEACEYGVQIGRNPGQVNGNFNFVSTFDIVGTNVTTGTNILDSATGLGGLVVLPDPTNEPARIELTASQLNLSNSRLRAEGMVIVNATNLAGSATVGSDWGEISSRLGATNGSLVVSNFYPTNFQRLRGDIYAWSANWVNTFTNGVTNIFHYHMLIVDQNLGGNFHSAIRDLNLTGSNSIDVEDSMFVINSDYFNTTNLTFNANENFTQNAGNLMPANMPKLRYFLNNSNAVFSVDSVLDIGFNVNELPSSPLGRTYTVTNITNFGAMSATAPLLQAQTIENDGSITASNNGSMVIQAASLGLGLALTNATNFLVADQNVTLSAITIGASNSHIFAGGTDATGQGLLILQTTSAGQISDFVSGAPSTNTPLINFWQVTDGFSLPVKPATGDLFGTEITTIATNYTVALHTWAGADMGPVAQGFVDNVTIGRLKLSRKSTNAVLHFTGAGAQNGLYVDYLEFDTNSLYGSSPTAYRDGLVIDPNLTIYFAACNFPISKLTNDYPGRLVWVANFAGPNSTVAVPYYDSTNFCLMNSDLAFSTDFGFFPPVPNSANQPYVLNNPTNITNFISCPTDVTLLTDLSEGALLQEFNVKGGGSNLNMIISTMGRGSVSPKLKQGQIVAGKEYALTATPEPGWIFSGWSASGLSEKVDTTSRVLKFTLENDLVLTANFKPKTFTLAQGVYCGLFTNWSPASDNSGWFTFTLSDNGALSGRFLMGPASYKFSSSFSSNGTTDVVAKDGNQSLYVTLKLDLENPTGQVTGLVTDGTWDDELLGYVVPAWTRANPSPFAGQYTMVLTNAMANALSGGDSYGSLIVSKLGVLSVAGRLADGNAFSQSAPVSTNGLWPFYTYVAKGNDVLLGWIAFRDDVTGGPTANESGIFWSKASSSKGGYYAAGFTNFFDLAGSPYVVPGRESPNFSLANPGIILSGGGLTGALTNALAYDGKVMYSGTNLTLKIDAAEGSFTGQWKNPENGLSIKLGGVVLQNQESALGFFLGTNNESGVVLLQNQ